MSTEDRPTSRMNKYLLETVLAGTDPGAGDDEEYEVEDWQIEEVLPA